MPRYLVLTGSSRHNFAAESDPEAIEIADRMANTGSRTVERGVAHCALWREDGTPVTAEAKTRGPVRAAP